MALNEACQVWIDQRIQEELEAGKSYQAIGREIAAEITRVFETDVKPGTIFQKARRKAADTNVSEEPTPQVIEEKEEIKESNRGGQREGAGRKPGATPEQVITKKYNSFLQEVKKAKKAQWQDVPYGLACEMIGELNNYI